MKNLRYFFIYLLVIGIPLLVKAESKTLVLLGDSLTEGLGVSADQAYPHLLEQKIKEIGKTWKVINSGVSGSTTASAASRMKWILKSKPQLIILALGANDGLRGVDVENTKKNLIAAIDIAAQEKIPVVLAGIYMPPNYGKNYTEKFNKIFPEISKTKKIRLIPFLLDGVAGIPEHNLPDGIHPNEKGHRIIADNLFRQIKDLL